MNVYICESKTKVGDAPVGLFLLDDGEIIAISEYRKKAGQREAIIVSSGEAYCGNGDEATGYPMVIQ